MEARRLARQSEEIPILAQSMDAMGRLAGGIAHVFNNLLTAIACETELALARLSGDEPARRNLREIEKVGWRGVALTRQLLAFSGRQVLHPKMLQLNHLLTEMEERVRRFLGPEIELRLELHPDLDRVQVDPEQIENVVMNLVSNARDAMPDGGRLTLETMSSDVLAEDSHPMHAKPGRYVLLKVSDTGPGMPDEVRRHAFEPFFSTKGGMEITGLGLSTAYGIVTQSGGQILADSEPGSGTRFHIYLPSAEQASAGERVEAGAWETLLLVEDEENVRQPLIQILGNRGYKVLAAADAFEAVQISQAHPGPIHLMITDVLMDGMSGVELAERLSFKRPEMLVLFATGYPAGLTEGTKLGGDANLLKKPFSGRELVAKICEVLESNYFEETFVAEALERPGHGPDRIEPDLTLQTPSSIPPTGHVRSAPLDSQSPEELSEAKTVADERSDLLYRKSGGGRLSVSEQERLELLTVRLKELLPPVSVGDLETLVEMAEEADRIRKRARERRQSFG